MARKREKVFTERVDYLETDARKRRLHQVANDYELNLSDILRAGSVLAIELLKNEGRGALLSLDTG